jgi:hypothetical protein
VRERLTIGQTVVFNQRCVLAGTVPRNSKGYTHAVLELAEGDKYTGQGVIESGTQAEVIDYASHGTGTRDYPIVRISGRAAVCHDRFLDVL